jgi:pyridoxine 5-phosphate synthase
MALLSVNINKVAVIRNSRGGNLPDVLAFAKKCEEYGAQGITVHPRPDERHIRYKDVRDLKNILQTELNVEGYPSEQFMELIIETAPHQVTLVPDPPDAVTSNAGWDTLKHGAFLENVTTRLKAAGCRVSIFIGPVPQMAIAASEIGADRIELYTEEYAMSYSGNREMAAAKYIETAEAARANGLGINAGHDLNLGNLAFLAKSIPYLDEVSIGHALVSDALYYGIENTIALYKNCLIQ